MRYKNEGMETAQNWARWFLPPDWMKEAIPYMRTAMVKAGIKLTPPEPDGVA